MGVAMFSTLILCLVVDRMLAKESWTRQCAEVKAEYEGEPCEVVYLSDFRWSKSWQEMFDVMQGMD